MISPALPLAEPAPTAARMAPLQAVPPGHLLVHEIYASLQGESTFQGRPCTFIRTTACHLRCSYCDTAHAFYAGTPMPVDDVIARVRAAGFPLVELTGGEPLLQPASLDLMARLCDEGRTVLLETSGAVATRGVDPRVRVILDVKTPSSGEAGRTVWANLERLQPHDEVKFVVGSREDFDFSAEVLKQHALERRCTVLFSPVSSRLAPAELAAWVLQARLPVRFQVQLHKVLWGDRRGV